MPALNVSSKSLLIFLALFGIAFLNTWPFLVSDVGGDKLVHYAFLQCFGDAFWRGELYPRWCMEANAGLGAPFFYFYFPGAYWITSLFYPLKNFGVSLLDILRLSVLLATVITATTAYVWLRTRAEPKVALLLTAVYLFAPYRMELLLHRSAFAELWCMALIPLMMLAAERVIANSKQWPWLALTFAGGFFLHAPATIMAGLFIGLYMLLMAENKKEVAIAGVKAVLLALAIAAIYLLPAIFYHGFTPAPDAEETFNGWPNRAITLADVTGKEMYKLKFMAMLACGLGWIIAVGIYALLWVRYRGPMLREHKREFYVWGIMLAAIFVVVMPVVNVLLQNIPLLQAFLFPWRAQIMLPIALAALMAFWVEYKPNAKKTVVFDLGLFVGLLLLVGQMMMQQFDYTQGRAFYDKVINARIMNSYEHATIWTDKEYRSRDTIFDMLDRSKKHLPKIETAAGTVNVEQVEFAPNQIRFKVNVLSDKATLRLYQRYFPSWYIERPDGMLMDVEPHSGLMLLILPHGKREVVLNHDIYGVSAPWWVRLSPLISLLGIILVYGMARRTVLTARN